MHAFKKHEWLMPAALLTAYFGLALGSSLAQSLTFDEGFYIARGWAYWHERRLLMLGHPPLNDLLAGAAALLEPHLPAPASLPGWAEQDPLIFSRALLWGSDLNALRIIALARFPFLLIGALLGAVIYRWAADLYGPWGGVLALMLYALSPTVLAHTGLAATDLGVAAAYVASLFAWHRFTRRGGPAWLIACGVLSGLALAAKFSALLLPPTLLILYVWHFWRPVRTNPEAFKAALAAGATLIGAGLLGLWAGQAFTLRPLAADMLVGQFQHFLTEATDGHRAYLFGAFSQQGWWYYHLVALAVKEPLPTLFLLGLAAVYAVGRGLRPGEHLMLLPAGVYLAALSFSSLNVGVRYLLPLLPLIYVFTGRLAARPLRSRELRGVLIVPSLGALIGVCAWAYPNYIPFFNLAVGGPANGARILADSNLDWGQGLIALSAYLDHNDIDEPIYLSYFGQADPTYYGIDYRPLPGWPPLPGGEEDLSFHPMNPQPGLYAISASNLLGLQLYNPEAYGYFRARQPLARVGYSIYLYEVPATPPAEGQPWIAQCLPPDDAAAESAFAALTGYDDLRMVYIKCREAVPYYEGDGWLVLPPGVQPIIDLGPADYLARGLDGSPAYSAWRLAAPPPPPQNRIDFPQAALPLPIAGTVELLGYHISASSLAPGDTLTLTAWWAVRQPPQPGVSIFAHLIAPGGALAQGADGLGVVVEDWQPGMIFIQQHVFPLSADFPPGEYTLTIGLYSTFTGQRFAVTRVGERVVDRIVLRVITVDQQR